MDVTAALTFQEEKREKKKKRGEERKQKKGKERKTAWLYPVGAQ